MSLASRIEHSLLKPTTTRGQIEALCSEALEYGFYSVCIHPCYVPLARQALKGSSVRVTTVVGFPLGMDQSEVKLYEAREAALRGADELDIVMNIGMALEGRWDDLRRELTDIVIATRGLVHKVIIEACYLDDEQKRRAALEAVESGAWYVKTSTGFGPGGATVEDVAMLHALLKGKALVKAAGGISTLSQAMAMLEAGAALLGTSRGVEIIKEAATSESPVLVI